MVAGPEMSHLSAYMKQYQVPTMLQAIMNETVQHGEYSLRK